LAAEIESEFGIKVELIAGSGGVYRITADENVLFSKHESGNQFPQVGAIVEAIRDYRGQA